MFLLALALALQDRWTFDGDVPGAQVEGRLEYRDSAVGGKALVFNGVDTRVTMPGSPTSYGLWFFAADVGPMTPAGGLTLEADGSIRLGSLRTSPRTWYPGQWVHVAVTAQGLKVNGEMAAEGPPPRSEGPFVLGGAGKTAFRGLIDDLRLKDLDGALDALPWYRPRPHLQTPFERFELKEGDIVAFLGGESMASGAGAIEEQLALAVKGVRFRNLAWEGDTVFERRRDVNFGGLGRSLARAGTSVVIVQFGQMESLQGEVEAFRAAYDKLLAEIQERTKRIVILSPTPFQRRDPGLAPFVAACQELAAKRRALFVDLSRREVPTRNGVHPTDAGRQDVAGTVARALGLEERPVPTDLRTSIQEKNRLWFDYWRPMNWAFIEGDRDQQPFSRDPRDNRVRGLAIEMQDYLPLIRRLEER